MNPDEKTKEFEEKVSTGSITQIEQTNQLNPAEKEENSITPDNNTKLKLDSVAEIYQAFLDQNIMTRIFDRGVYKVLTMDSSTPRVILILAFASFLVEYSGVWWLAFVMGFLGAMFIRKDKVLDGFILGFIGLALGWGLHMAIIAFSKPLDLLNVYLSMFNLDASFVVIITVSIGALLGGLGGMNGALCKQWLWETKWFAKNKIIDQERKRIKQTNNPEY